MIQKIEPFRNKQQVNFYKSPTKQMGNHLTFQQVTQNLPQYKPNFSQYQLIPHNNPSSQTQRKWQHKMTRQRLVQKCYHVRTWVEFYELVEIFAFRYNSFSIMATRYLMVDNQEVLKKQEKSGAFQSTMVRVFYEESMTDLSHFKEIPQQDSAYLLTQTLKGFHQLTMRTGFPFQLRQQMFHITWDKKLKVWPSHDITQSITTFKLRPLPSESYMIHQLLQIIKDNVYFTTESQKIIGAENYMPPIVVDELIRACPQNFQQAIKLMEVLLQVYDVKVGCDMGCLNELSVEELAHLMVMSKMQSRQVSNSPLFLQLNSHQLSNQYSTITLVSSPCQQKPTTPTKPFAIQSSSIPVSRNFSMSNLRSTPLQRQSSLMRGSRSGSSKNKGLSLVKKQQMNQNSLIRSSKPVSSVNNQRSGITIENLSKMPPKCSVKKVHFIGQEKQNLASLTHPPTNKKHKQLHQDNHQSRGISITKKEEPIKKSSAHTQSPLHRANNHCGVTKTQNQYAVSNFSNNCSTVSMGPLPVPQYYNHSKAKTSIIPVNFSINFGNTSSSSEPFVPSQSLTRFQKELINCNNTTNSLNSSGAQFYEVPRIYVHSPKAKGKIIRVDSESTQQQPYKQQINTKVPLVKHSTQTNSRQQDNIKQQHYEQQIFYHQLPQNPQPQIQSHNHAINNRAQLISRNPSMNQFNSYIQDNTSLFTDPRLYSYITDKQVILQNKEGKAQRGEKKKRSYIDYLANVQISESLDYKTAEQLFEVKQQQNNSLNRQSHSILQHNHLSINDFRTIEQIDQLPHSSDLNNQKQEENLSFLPINLCPNLSQNHLPSTVRRGHQQSMVIEYKRFYDDTNRTNNSPNKHSFSPMKRISYVEIKDDVKQNIKYGIAQNWQKKSPPKLCISQSQNVHFAIPQNVRPLRMISQPVQLITRQNSPSPMSKVIYSGARQPAINPLLLQDMQRIRQNRVC